jgi:hypothetical protein
MTRQMRFLQQTDARNAARIWKLVPARFAQRMKLHPLDQQLEKPR